LVSLGCGVQRTKEMKNLDFGLSFTRLLPHNYQRYVFCTFSVNLQRWSCLFRCCLHRWGFLVAFRVLDRRC
jgi:hypothetical protein